MKTKSGQSMLEYTILIIIILAAYLTMQNYVKRGFQGRWRSSVDDLGEQYDPRTADTHIIHTILSTSNTSLTLQDAKADGKQGYYTLRTDKSASTETRNGLISVGN
jgi:hypothetical protein